MDFYAVLDQAIDLLRRRGRVTYRALRLQLQLDDDTLAVLKEELIKAQRLAVDEGGEVLVWTGGPGASLPPGPSALQSVPLPALQAAQAAPADVPAAASRPPDAERRQLTVLFCDLVGSTPLAEQLDPEDLREVVRAYQQTCAGVVQRFEGYIAQLLGDALLVYFGWPQAHEDNAQRAVRAALGMLGAMGTLNTGLERDRGLRLAIRVGIHTGPVVIGEMGGGGRQEQLALGETPNIAARLQGLAAPDTVAISATTFRLIQGYFTCQALGEQTLKGVSQLMAVYRVLQESGVQGRLEVAATHGLTPLVGRAQEVALLLDRWAQAQEGMGQVVVLSGEAGIGKSRLVQVLTERVSREGALRLALRCSPYHTNSALYPVIEHLERLLQARRNAAPEAKLARLEDVLREYGFPLAEVVPLFAALLSLPPPADYPPLHLSPQQQKQKTQEALVAWLVAETERQPVLEVWEDVHWADPSTLELLSLVLDQAPTARLLTLLTCRPEFRPPWPPRSHLSQITLPRFARPQTEAMVAHLTGGKALPAAVLDQIVAKTDGVPLFIEELTKALLESGVLQEHEDRYALTGPLPAMTIPSTLQDALMARLDRLVTAKGVAQLGATIGRQFSYALLQAIAPLDDATLQRELGRLADAELLYQRGLPPHAIYVFKHALVQEAAYQSLLRSTRQQYHQRIAQALAAHFPETAETQPELLAQHYTAAGLHEHALPYWQRAGERAIQRSAPVEAIAHLTRALELLTTLPETPARAQHELVLQTLLGPQLITAHGYGAPAVENTYARARELCQQVGEAPQLLPVLTGLAAFYMVRAEYQTACEVSEQCLGLAECVQDPAAIVGAEGLLGVSLFWLGEFPPARAHLEHGIALYNPQQPRNWADNGVACIAQVAWVLWVLGYLDQALVRSREALTLAQELSHPFSLGLALYFAAKLHQYRREVQATQARAEAAITLSSERGFPSWLANGMVLRGWALAAQGQRAEGIAQLRQGLAARRATGEELAQPYFLALLAEACQHAGQTEEGLTVLAEALALVDRTAEHWWEAELYRLKGELLLQSGGQSRESGVLTLDTGLQTLDAEAEACFRQALDIARHQQARSLELRAAMSLSRLWQRQGKRAAARQLLAEVYGWFTEGFDTADLQEARALLDALEE
jgi:class 3 adenylate cyclase/predicted ATPase